jgi:hypothetical protein
MLFKNEYKTLLVICSLIMLGIYYHTFHKCIFLRSPSVLTSINKIGVILSKHIGVNRVLKHVLTIHNYQYIDVISDDINHIIDESHNLISLRLNAYCNNMDYVFIIGDTPPLVLSVINLKCTNNIILFVSNRFNYNNKNKTNVIIDAIRTNLHKIRIVCNNVGDKMYLEANLLDCVYIFNYLSSHIDPIMSNCPETNKTIFLLHPTQKHMRKHIPDHITILRHNDYGGPICLMDKLVIQIPYQTNTMGFDESLSVGVRFITMDHRCYDQLYGDTQLVGISTRKFFYIIDLWRYDFITKFCDWHDLLPTSNFWNYVLRVDITIKLIQWKTIKSLEDDATKSWKQILDYG